MMVYAPTTIDLSRVPTPAAIEIIDQDAMLAGAIDRFLVDWNASRLIDPTLPEYTAEDLVTDPVIIELRSWTFFRVLDRQRVNDVFEQLLAIRASGTNLDAIAAGMNVARLVIKPATSTASAVMESDARLLKRYLLAFDKPSAGSVARYLYEAMTAWPELLDARVNGHAVHGRRGDTDIVIIGPGGRLATSEERALVRAAVTADHVQPEAVAVTVLDATRVEYSVSFVIQIPTGPAETIVRQEAINRVRTAGDERMLIGGEVPPGLLPGSAYGQSIIIVKDQAPVTIVADPYSIPVLIDIGMVVEVRP